MTYNPKAEAEKLCGKFEDIAAYRAGCSLIEQSLLAAYRAGLKRAAEIVMAGDLSKYHGRNELLAEEIRKESHEKEGGR